MCGVAGIIAPKDPEARLPEAEALIGALAHRGPDGIRTQVLPHAVLAHARLSIIDLETGWQPLTAAGSTVVGNGEIYNYLELIEAFDLKDSLTTGSDFEPLLHLYAREGPRAFDRLRGMYAFCLIGFDGRAWLVRDGFGVKPLYYRQDQGELSFASEPRPLAGARPVMDADRAEELLTFNYTVGRGTLFKGVRRLPPGEVAEVAHGRLIPKSVRPAVPAAAAPSAADEDRALQALDQALEDSVRVHQRSDAPYGLFLSGGADSAAVATMMSRLNERPVTAFTCGFERDRRPSASGAKAPRDERAQAEKVARALDLDWREVEFGEADFWRVLPEAARCMDDPAADYAVLPTWRLAEAAKGTLTVVLTGEGGDELFGGYGRYRRALRPALFGGRPAEPRAEAPFLKDRGAAAVSRWRDVTRPPVGLGRLQEAQARDIAAWLPADLLLKLDRCLMAHGLEGRTPFLDPEVARFAFHLPDKLKVRGRTGKWLLRRWLARHCPAADPFARKAGFTVPVDRWIAPRARLLGRTIAAVEGVARVCDPAAVQSVFADDKGRPWRWNLLFFALWWRIHIDQAEPKDALTDLAGEP